MKEGEGTKLRGRDPTKEEYVYEREERENREKQGEKQSPQSKIGLGEVMSKKLCFWKSLLQSIATKLQKSIRKGGRRVGPKVYHFKLPQLGYKIREPEKGEWKKLCKGRGRDEGLPRGGRSWDKFLELKERRWKVARCPSDRIGEARIFRGAVDRRKKSQ